MTPAPQKATMRKTRFSCRLADYKYQKDKVIGTYAQDETGILAANHHERENQLSEFERYDLDMGFKFASIPRVVWLEIQKLGIETDTNAIINFLRTKQVMDNKNYFTTKKRLI